METNDAKRKALEAFLHGHIEGKICAPGNYPSPENLEYLHSVVKKAQDALAQPRKNFEVGTLAEQRERFLKFCAMQDCRHRCPFRMKKDAYECMLAWGQTPYDETTKDMCHTTKLTLDEAIAHAASCADDTPCGQNHKQLAEWLKEFKALKNGDIAKLRESFVTIQKIISAHANTDAKFCITLIAQVACAALNE